MRGAGIVASAHVVSGGITVADNFDRANGALGANWQNSAGGSPTGWTISSNKAVRSTGTGEDFALYTTDLGSNDMFVEADISGAMNGQFVVLIARANLSGGANFYQAFANPSGGYVIAKTVGGSFSNILTNGTAHADTPHLRFEVQGTALRLYDGGVLKLSTTDSQFTTGHIAGMNASNSGLSIVDNWQAGAL